MIITDRFVMLNFPKTGSSFARDVLREVHQYDTWRNRLRRRLPFASPSMIELCLPKLDRRFPKGLRDQHGTYKQIPPAHMHKPVVSITRNPFDRYVSAYLYGWWKTVPHAPEAQLREKYPHFPHLSFREFYEMINHFGRANLLQDVTPRTDLGFHSLQFIQFYFRDPARTLRLIDLAYIQQKTYLDDMAEVVFLHQENLGDELQTFLLGLGYLERSIDFIRHADRVNVTPRCDHSLRWQELYSEELIEDVLKRDRLLFELFPEYRIDKGNSVGPQPELKGIED